MTEGPIIPDPNSPEINPDEPGTPFVHEEPDEILEWMAEQGIKEQKFSVSIRKYPLGGGSDGKYMPYMEKNKAPNMFDIGKWYGPGKYVVGFSFHMPSEVAGAKSKLTRKDHTIILGEEFQELHDEYMLEQWAAKEKNAEMIGQRMKVKKAYQSGGGKPGGSEMENLMSSLQQLKALGVPIGGGNQGGALSSESGMLQLLVQNMQQSSENIMKIMMTNQNNMMTLMGGMLQGNNNRQQNPESMFKEVSTLIMGAMNLKETLTPERKGALDKIVDMAGEVLPAIIAIHQQKGLEAAQSDPTVKMAKGMPQFQDIANNEMDREYVIRTMDEKQGEDQTDILLATLGWQRTANTQRKTTPADVVDAEATDVPPAGDMGNSYEGGGGPEVVDL